MHGIHLKAGKFYMYRQTRDSLPSLVLIKRLSTTWHNLVHFHFVSDAGLVLAEEHEDFAAMNWKFTKCEEEPEYTVKTEIRVPVSYMERNISKPTKYTERAAKRITRAVGAIPRGTQIKLDTPDGIVTITKSDVIVPEAVEA